MHDSRESTLISQLNRDFANFYGPEKEIEIAEALGDSNNVFLKVLQANLNYQEDLVAYGIRMVEIAAAINQEKRNAEEKALIDKFVKDQKEAAEYLTKLIIESARITEEEKKSLAAARAEAEAEVKVLDLNPLVDQLVERLAEIQNSLIYLPTFDKKAWDKEWKEFKSQANQKIEDLTKQTLFDEKGNEIKFTDPEKLKERLKKNCAPVSPEKLAKINPNLMGDFTDLKDIQGRAKAVAAFGGVKQELEFFNAIAEARADPSAPKIEPKVKEEVVEGRIVVKITAGRLAAMKDVMKLMKLDKNKKFADKAEKLYSDPETTKTYEKLMLEAYSPEISKKLEARTVQLVSEISALEEYNSSIPDAPPSPPDLSKSRLGGGGS